MPAIRIGTSGWSYKHWRSRFYPSGLRQRDELTYIADKLGSPQTYASRYSDAALDRWATAIAAWAHGGQPADAARVTDLLLPSRAHRDVYCYFDNDGDAHAPLAH